MTFPRISANSLWLCSLILFINLTKVRGRARICAHLKGNLHCEQGNTMVLESHELSEIASIEPFIHLGYKETAELSKVTSNDPVLALISQLGQSALADEIEVLEEVCYDASCKDDHRWLPGFQEFLEHYMKFLQINLCTLYCVLLASYPLVTKSITAAFIGGAGDVLAQVVEINALGRQKQVRHARRFHFRRTFAIAVEGMCISGPLMHYAYDMLEHAVPVKTPDPDDDLYEWLAAAFHVFVDAVLMDTFSVGTILVTTAIVEGRRQDLTHELWQDYVPAVKVSWASSLCFAPLQCALFRFLQVDYRVLAMNFQDVLWNGAISYMAHRSKH